MTDSQQFSALAFEKAKEDSKRAEALKERKAKTEVASILYERLWNATKARPKFRRVVTLKNGNKYRRPCIEPSSELLRREKATMVTL